MTMASVLFGFIDRPLRSSQCSTAVEQSDSVETDIASLSPIYSSVSSAYCVLLIPKEMMTHEIGHMNRVHSSGPSTGLVGHRTSS